MCSVGGSRLQTVRGAQLVDQQQRRDVADAALHRRQPDQLGGPACPALRATPEASSIAPAPRRRGESAFGFGMAAAGRCLGEGGGSRAAPPPHDQ
jgi:hypothetical protein